MRLITNECVSKGHPDKVADIISDTILDDILLRDPKAKVAIETMVKDNNIILGGEVTTNAVIDYDSLVREAIRKIGYDDPSNKFYWKDIFIHNFIGKQSPEINAAVDNGGETGAGDQGFMTGYATNETETFMPTGVYIARKLINMLSDHFSKELGPDAKSQVTMAVESDGSLSHVHHILISTVHKEHVTVEELRTKLIHHIKTNKMGLTNDIFELITNETTISINPAGSWNVGGPVSDCGVTGRKIVVDQYGPYCPVGGGAYSGKDGTKVDRSGSYLCRYIAKNIVASGLAGKCQVEIAYQIGVAEPIAINIDTFNSLGTFGEETLVKAVKKTFPLTPSKIMEAFQLTFPVDFSYADLASEGHYGRLDIDLPWERDDKAEIISQEFSNIFFAVPQ